MNSPQFQPAPAKETNGVKSPLRSSLQFLLALGVTVAFLIYLLAVPAAPRSIESDDSRRENEAVVEVAGPGLLRMKPGGPLDKKITIVAVRHEKLTEPLLVVSGRVVASLRPGKTKEKDFWQFDSPEVLTVFSDWQTARSDIGFTEKQLVQVKKLATVKLEAQKRVVERLENLVKAGTDTIKDLTAERATQLQIEVTGEKDVHEADTSVRVAKRKEATMSRQLQQAGLDPDFLLSATSDIDIVMADVPEGKLNRVNVGQECRARFFGLPDDRFHGKVSSISPVLSKERRSLRVLFAVEDLKDQLRPGMFADIGIGIEPRETLLMPADGILHIGRSDYALAAADADTWRVAEVQIGEPHGVDVEILDGLKTGERVVGKGAILFKPLVVRSLAVSANGETGK